jgi:hypothetical protein
MKERETPMRFPILPATATSLAFVIFLPMGGQHASADFIMSVSGEFESFTSFSVQFDGANTVEDALPPLFNVDQLAGGSFAATFSFPSTDPPPSGNFASYVFGPGFGLSYTLFDASGGVVHQGSNPSDAGATVLDDFAPAGSPVDAVNLFSFVNDVSGLITPPALYSPVPDVFALQSTVGFNGEVSASANYITGLSIPVDASTYLSFPERIFTTGMTFGDGDWKNGVEPFQYVETSLSYTITTVSIVPAPASLIIVLAGIIGAGRRRRD